MQFNGIGGDHDADMHHVTNCMHDHTHYKKDVGAAGMRHSSGEAPGAVPSQPEGQLSLSSWLERIFGSGKRVLRGIWSGSENGVSGTEGNQAAGAQVLTGSEREGAGEGGNSQTGAEGTVLHSGQIAAASSAVTPNRAIPDNPYFAPVENGKRAQETMWHKLRVRCRNVAGQMSRHLSGKFFNAQTKGSFQSGQERPKEDLRKHSKYREDTLEIDCVLTDDSYLLDSYDRKGAYSTLSAKK